MGWKQGNRLRSALDIFKYNLQKGFCQCSFYQSTDLKISYISCRCGCVSVLERNSNRKICNNHCYTELDKYMVLFSPAGPWTNSIFTNNIYNQITAEVKKNLTRLIFCRKTHKRYFPCPGQIFETISTSAKWWNMQMAPLMLNGYLCL